MTTTTRSGVHVSTTAKQDIYNVIEYTITEGDDSPMKVDKQIVRYGLRYKRCPCDLYKVSKQCKHIDAVKEYKLTSGASNSKFIQHNHDQCSSSSGIRTEKYVVTREAASKWTFTRNNNNDNDDDKQKKKKKNSKIVTELITDPSCPTQIHIVREIPVTIEKHQFYKLRHYIFKMIKYLNNDSIILPRRNHVQLCIQKGHNHKDFLVAMILQGLKLKLEFEQDFNIDGYDFMVCEDIVINNYKKHIVCGYDNCYAQVQKRCHKCGRGYCKRSHQKKDWKRNNHIKQCNIRKQVLNKWIK